MPSSELSRTSDRGKLIAELRRLLKDDLEQFLSALVNTIDTVYEGSAPQLVTRRLQIERETEIVSFIAGHFN